MDDLSSYSNAELSELITLIKSELNRRNASSDLDRTNGKWRKQAGIEPLPAYEGFAHALTWQREKRQRPSKKQARAAAIMRWRPELFIHRMDENPFLERLLRLVFGWDADGIPEQFREWSGQRGKRRAEEEFERIDNKLRELTQRPDQASACLRPALRGIREAYSV